MSNSANPIRGEVPFAIRGREYILRPSFENLVAAEGELGSLFALVERAAQGSLTVAEITGLIWHCLPPEQRPDREAVGSAVIALGLVKATSPVRAILADVLQGSA